MSLRFDTIQQNLASLITNEIENVLETPISIGSLQVIHLDEIVLKKITLRGQNGDTIIFAEKATAHISPYKLLKKRVQINTLAFAAPDIRISRATPESPLNIQFIIDKLKQDSSKEKKTIALRINQLLVYDGKFSYDIENAPVQEGLDPSHIAVNGIDCNISMRKFISEELDLLIRSIKGHERSGLELSKLKTRIRASEGNIRLAGTKILLPNSIVLSDSITISYDKGNLQALDIAGNISSERFALTDVAPLIKDFPEEIPAIAFDIRSNTDSTSSRTTILAKSLDGNMSSKTIVTIDNPYNDERVAKIYLRNLDISKRGIESLQKHIKDGNVNIAEKTGDCNFNGEIEYNQGDFTGNFRAETINGIIAAEATYDKEGMFDIEVYGDAINIDKLAKIGHPLSCSLETKANGCFNGRKKHIKLAGTVTDLDNNGYAIAPIEFSGEYDMQQNSLVASARTEDPGVTAKIDLDYKGEKEHRVILALDVDSITPSAIGLGERFDETFSFNFDSEFTYSNKQKSLLNAKLQNFTYRNDEEKRSVRNLHFCDNRTEEQRLTMINSDFVDVSIIGQYDYKSIVSSLYRLLETHTPSIFAKTKRSKEEKCNYIFKCDIKNSHFVSDLLNLPATINKPSHIEGACNDNISLFTINTTFNDVEIGKAKLSSINLKGESTKEAFTINSHLVKPPKAKFRKSADDDLQLDINLRLSNDTIQNSLSWGNKRSKKRIEGELGMKAILSKDENDNLFVKAEILPDSIIQNDSIWYLSGSTVQGNLDKINISGLYLYNESQHLRLDGTVGKDESDILNISASNLEVSTIFDFIRFRILTFNGNATGTAQASSLLSAPDVNGNFKVDSFKIDNGYLGDADLNIGWRNSDKSIFLNAQIHNDDGDISKVNGFLSQVNDTIHLDIDADKINACFINKMVKSFMSDIEGTGSGKVQLLGTWRQVGLFGSVALNCSARINPTHVRYTLHGDSLYFTDGKMSFKDAHVTDKRGNSGWLSGEVTHRYLSNWACNLNARVNNALVYDTYNFDELPLYGTIYATGNANLIANDKGLFLKAEVRNEPNSRIVYNSSEAAGARDNSFVTFIDSSKKHVNNEDKEETAKKPKNTESNMNLDFLIDANEGLQVRVYTNLKSDDYIDLYGNGTINAVYDEKEGFSMKGNMELDRGTYKITVQDIFTKEFNIAEGSSLLFNGDPYYATLDLKTKYLVPSANLSALTTESTNRKSVKVNCLMNITGTLASPILNFDLELPEGSEEEKEMLASATSTPEQKNMQFIYLLGIGKFYTYDYNNPLATNTQSNTAVESLISNTLSGQLNNMLGQIIDNGNWNISGNFSTSERGWNSMEVEGMLEGRLLNDRLLINGNLGYRENPVANRNVIGDFELQWLLNRTGTISLRAYSKTNDRYFSKTNLTTQGAGIILRHDFNSWKWWKKDEEETKEKKGK